MKTNSKIISLIICSFIISSLCVTCFAADVPRCVDNASLLTTDELSELNSYYDTLSEENNFDIAFVVFDNMAYYGYGEDDIAACADDYFDNNGFGYGENKDGVLLMLDIASGQYYISTCGYGIEAVTDAGIDMLGENFVEDYRSGNYYTGFSGFADETIELLSMAKSGNTYDPYAGYDYDYGYEFAGEDFFNWPLHIIISLVIGIVAGFIVANIHKGKLTTVKMNNSAASYEVPGSLKVVNSNEYFLYSNVVAVPKPKDTPTHSGGSSTHVSSSGTTHGGGGGRL